MAKNGGKERDTVSNGRKKKRGMKQIQKTKAVTERKKTTPGDF